MGWPPLDTNRRTGLRLTLAGFGRRPARSLRTECPSPGAYLALGSEATCRSADPGQRWARTHAECPSRRDLRAV